MTADLTDRDLRQRDVVSPEKLAACHALVIGVGATVSRRHFSLMMTSG